MKHLNLPSLQKKYFLIIGAILLLALASWFLKNPTSKYFYTNCNIYDLNGHLIHSTSGYQFCQYHPEGLILASNTHDKKLTLFDKYDEALWTSNEYIHHDLKFSNDLSFLYMIQSKTEKINHKTVRSDCFSKRNYSNQILAEWCLSDHIDELLKMGFSFTPWAASQFPSWTSEFYDFEISHANSMYEIPDITGNTVDSAFSSGNFIINIYGPSKAVIILDKNLKNILWSKNLSQFKINTQVYDIDTHDVQILKNGHIIAYINKMTLNSLSNTTLREAVINYQLIEFDPLSDKIYWFYAQDTKNTFANPTNGSITKVNSTFYYLDNTTGGKYIEISEAGKKLLEIDNPQTNPLTKKSMPFYKPKPMLDLLFLKSRNIY